MRAAPRSTVPGTPPRVSTRAGLLTAAAVLLLPAAATASPLIAAEPAPPAAHSARVHGGLAPTSALPSQVATAQRLSTGARSNWLIQATGDPAALAALAAANGGTFNRALSLLTVPAARADAVAHRLGKAVSWSGADVAAARSSSFDLPGNVQTPWSRSVGLAPSLTPAAGALAPIGIVDDAVDHSVAELASIPVINGVGATEPHGTMVASVAAAPFDGMGVVGVAPGAPVLSWGTTLTCSDVSAGITSLVKRGVKVINISLGFDQNCFPLWEAVSYAYSRGVALVVASGNDGDTDNPLSFPASYPHVITAAAIDQTLSPAYFSNYDEYVDIAAPGVDVPVDMPRRSDGQTVADRVVDGVTTASGTSFASPYIAGGASWILGARPDLDPGQLAAVLRAGAHDLSTTGWDKRTGYGLLQIAPSMAVPTPERDLLEPNDYPAFTTNNGTFRKRTIWKGGAPVSLTALGDSADDAVDAYRVHVPAHTRVVASLTASEGLTNLFAFDQSVATFTGKPLDSSTRSGTKTDRIAIRNTSKNSRVAFVVVNTVPNGKARLTSKYTLTVKRG